MIQEDRVRVVAIQLNYDGSGHVILKIYKKFSTLYKDNSLVLAETFMQLQREGKLPISSKIVGSEELPCYSMIRTYKINFKVRVKRAGMKTTIN